jgi:hypothetical protein
VGGGGPKFWAMTASSGKGNCQTKAELAEATGDPFISIAGQWATDNFCSQISDSPIAWVPNRVSVCIRRKEKNAWSSTYVFSFRESCKNISEKSREYKLGWSDSLKSDSHFYPNK